MKYCMMIWKEIIPRLGRGTAKPGGGLFLTKHENEQIVKF